MKKKVKFGRWSEETLNMVREFNAADTTERLDVVAVPTIEGAFVETAGREIRQEIDRMYNQNHDGLMLPPNVEAMQQQYINERAAYPSQLLGSVAPVYPTAQQAMTGTTAGGIGTTSYTYSPYANYYGLNPELTALSYPTNTYIKQDDCFVFYSENKWFMKVKDGNIIFNTEEFPEMTASQQAKEFLNALQAITHMEKGQFTFVFKD